MFHLRRKTTRPTAPWPWFAGWVLSLLFVACRGSEPSVSIIETPELLILSAPPQVEGLLEASIEDGGIVCRGRISGEQIPYLTFQRRGKAMAYGIYGLGGERNGFSVDPPLDGSPVVYPDRGHGEVLQQLFIRCGVGESRARDLVFDYGDDWFAPGLRVLMVVAPSLTPALVGATLEARGRATLVHFELSQ